MKHNIFDLFSGSSDDDIVFRDVLFNLVIIFLVMIVLLMFLLGKKDTNKSSAEDYRRGSMYVEISWPNNMDVDIDLWGLSPADEAPISFKNKNGKSLSLIRDDLGYINDFSNLNYELMFSRGLPIGEWIFTTYFYSSRVSIPIEGVPVRVTIKVALQDGTTNRKSKDVYNGIVYLTRIRQEAMLLRFFVDKNGTISDKNMDFYSLAKAK